MDARTLALTAILLDPTLTVDEARREAIARAGIRKPTPRPVGPRHGVRPAPPRPLPVR